MTDSDVLALSGRALYLILLLSAPMLIGALVVGLVISIIQATTQIQEQTLSFVPKIVVTFVSVIIAGPWVASELSSLMKELFTEWFAKVTQFK